MPAAPRCIDPLATLHLPRALADDVVQDALRRVCVATAPGGEPIDNVEAFVTTVVHRAAIDIVRGCVRRPQVVDLRGVDPDAEVQGCWFTPASHLDAGADACAGEALASVRRTIHHLLGDDPMVRSPRWPWRYGLWARAFDADDDDDTLAGIAPFVRDPSVAADAVARVLVPPAAGGHTRRRVEVDVTDRPEMPRPSPALSVVERARYQGARRLGPSGSAIASRPGTGGPGAPVCGRQRVTRGGRPRLAPAPSSPRASQRWASRPRASARWCAASSTAVDARASVA